MIWLKRFFLLSLLFMGASFNGDAARWYPALNGKYLVIERDYEIAQNKNGDWHVGIDDNNERLATALEKKNIDGLLVANNIPSHLWGYKEEWWFPTKDNEHVRLPTNYRVFKDEEDDWWLDQGSDVVRALPIEKSIICNFLKENQIEQDYFYRSLDNIEKKIKKLPAIIMINHENKWMDSLAEIFQAIRLEEQLTLKPLYESLNEAYHRGIYASVEALKNSTHESQELYKKILALIKITECLVGKISPESTHRLDGYLENLNDFSKKCSELSDLFVRVTTTPVTKKQSRDLAPSLFSVYDGTDKNFSYSEKELSQRMNIMKNAIASISKKVYLNEDGYQVNEKEGKLVFYDEDREFWLCGDCAVNAQQALKIKILMSAFLSKQFYFAHHINVVTQVKKTLYLFVDGTQFSYDQCYQPKRASVAKDGCFKTLVQTLKNIIDNSSVSKSTINTSKKNSRESQRCYDKRVWLRGDGVFMLGDDIAEQFVSVRDAINEYFTPEYLEYAYALKMRNNRMQMINFINCRSVGFITNVYTHICEGNKIDIATGNVWNKYGNRLVDQIGIYRNPNRPNAETVWLDVNGYWCYGEKPINDLIARMIAKILE